MEEPEEQNKKIFIAFSSKDLVLSRMINHYLRQNLANVDIFFSDQTILPSVKFKDKCLNECEESDLGLVILTSYALDSPFVKDEIAIFRSHNIPTYYISMERDLHKNLGYDEDLQVKKFYEFKNPSQELRIILQDIEKILSIAHKPGKKEEKHDFERRYFKDKCLNLCERRDACTLLRSLKCAEYEMKILGENSLQPIHGGFEDIKEVLTNGGCVKVIINDYDSDEYKKRAFIEGADKTKRIHADWIATIGNLLQLNQLKNNGKLEVKITKEEVNASIVVIDNWELQYNKYNRKKLQDGKREFNSEVSLYLNRGKCKSKFEEYNLEFDEIWNDDKSEKLDLDKIDMSKIIPETFFV